LTAEQLQKVRAERWRHIANPLLTADDARAWLNTAGLCLFLPRRQQFLAPTPTFVEACAGMVSETPSREAIDNAAALMHRLVAAGELIPLNLFGSPSETPDFLVSREVFPHLFSLRGTRDWKTVPAGKASPLVIEIWKQLEKEGSQTSAEIQSALGRELTEAAVLRGLMELWSNLRVLPEYESGAPTRWSLTQTKFKDSLAAAGRLSQTAALSALVSLYLESVIAATNEEIETFLSPLTSRSRVRDTVIGLTATRQLAMTPMGTQSMIHLTGGLPAFAEPEVEEKPAGAEAAETPHKPRLADRAPRGTDRERKPYERKTGDRKTGERKTFGRKTVEGRSTRPAGASRSSDGEKKPFERKPFERKTGERKPFGARPAFGKKPFDKTARPFRRDSAKPADGERPAGGERPSFRPAARSGFDAGRSGSPRTGAPRTGSARTGAGGKFPPKRFGSKPGGSFGKDRPWTKRPTDAAEGGAAGSAEGARPFRPREGGAEKRSGGFGGPRKFDRPRKFDGAEGGAKERPDSGRPRPGGFKPAGSKPGRSGFGGSRSGGGKFGGSKSGASRPGFSKAGGFKSGGKAGDGEKRPFFRKRPDAGTDAGAAGESRPRTFSRPSFGGKTGGGKPGGRPGSSSRGPAGSGRTGGAGRSGGAWKGKPAGGGRFSKPAGSYSKPRTGGSDGAERPKSAGPRQERPAFRSDRPASSGPGSARAGSARSGSARPGFSKPGFSKGKPGGGAFRGKPSGGKSFGGGKKFGGAKKSGSFGDFKPRKPGNKPGGTRPPFRKRKDDGGTNAE
jgi:hypothetical protein